MTSRLRRVLARSNGIDTRPRHHPTGLHLPPLPEAVAGDASSVLVAVVLLSAVLAVGTPRFTDAANFDVLARAIAVSGLVGLAQMIVLSSGAMNLSVGAIGGLVAVTTGGLVLNFGIPPIVAAACGLAVGAVGGAANGLLILRTGLSPFIITLATASIYTGAAYGVTSARPYSGLPASFDAVGRDSVAGVPLMFALMLLVAVALAYGYRFLGLGRQILTLGASRQVAELAGVPVARTQLVVHALSGLLAAAAAILLIARLGEASPSIGGDWLLGSFAAPIIGGTLLAGGRASVLGTVLGASLLMLVANGLVFLNVDPYWRGLLEGLIILSAGASDRVRTLSVEHSERRQRRGTK